MQIHDLNTKALTNPAYVAFDDGEDTYKTEFNECVENAANAAVAAADLTENEVAFTSGDAASPTAWSSVPVLTSGSTLATLFNRISTMIKNVRWLYSKLGTTDISSIGNGTVTGALSTLNGKLNDSGWLSQSGYSYRQIGSVCIILMTKNNLSISNGWNTLFTMPAGYRPDVVTDNAAVLGGSVNTNGLFRISPNGVVQVYNSSSSSQPSMWGELIYFIPTT